MSITETLRNTFLEDKFPESDAKRKQCGTCKWWDRYGRSVVGKCTFTLPVSARQDNTMSMLYWQGQRCPVYDERKE